MSRIFSVICQQPIYHIKKSGDQKQYHNIQVNIQHTDTDYQEY